MSALQKTATLSIDQTQAESFLSVLGHFEDWHSFQTFDDDGNRKDRSLAKVLHGELANHLPALTALNERGAGVYVTVNETDLKGRTKDNITGVTAIWQDDDDGYEGGYPLEPNIVLQSSPGKFQRFWLVDGLNFEQHQQVMARMVSDYGADNNAKDLARVLRVPGFHHCKGDPVMVQIVGEINPVHYTAEEILTAFPSVVGAVKPPPALTAVGTGNVADIAVGGRNSALTSYAGSLWNKGVAEDEMALLLYARNKALSDPLPIPEVQSIISSAGRNFDPVEPPPDPVTVIEKMNSEHAVITIGGKVRILQEGVDDRGAPSPVFLSRADFNLLTAADGTIGLPVKRGDTITTKQVPVADYWLKHPDRRNYKGVTFNPAGCSDDFYNLYTGFAVKPVEGDCDLFLYHCKDIFCGGKEELYQYLLGWMADIVQNPQRKIGTALIARGAKGIGKGQFVHHFGSLFGHHFMEISNGSHMTGNFNAHLAKTLVLAADEALWAGDKKAEGVLKNLVTEPTAVLERKGFDPVSIPSYLRIMMTTNSDWAVPASGDERRWFVLDVSNKHKKDFAYFEKLQNHMNNGGREALLYFLLNHEIDVELREPPVTDALKEQIQLSLEPLEQWWFEVLSERVIAVPGQNDFEYKELKKYRIDRENQHLAVTPKSERRLSITRSDVGKAFIAYQRERGLIVRSDAVALGKFLAKVVPGLRSEGSSDRKYVLAPLTVMRSVFEKKVLGGDYQWDWGEGDCSPFEPKGGIGGLSLPTYLFYDVIRERYPWER